jgi:hypothetical protein
MKSTRDDDRFHSNFAQDVDRRINSQPVPDAVVSTPPTDKEYQADLEFAEQLHKLQFTPQPSFQTRLHAHLVDQLHTTKEVKPMFAKLFRSFLVAGTAALLLFVVVFAVSPDVRAASQEFVGRFAEADSPWAFLIRTNKPNPPEPGTLGQRVVPGDPENTKPGIPENISPYQVHSRDSVQRSDLISLEEAQKGLDFTILVPSVLPDGYSFMGVMPRPDTLPAAPGGSIQPPADLPKSPTPQFAVLLYSNSAGDLLTLSQRKLDSDLSAPPLPAGPDSIQEVTVNGQPAQYIEGSWTENGWSNDGNHLLTWQTANGLMVELFSRTLGLEQLLIVAESIR